MRMVLAAMVLITFPAVAVIVYGLVAGRPQLVLGALASLAINSLPFLVLALLLRGRRASAQDVAGH